MVPLSLRSPTVSSAACSTVSGARCCSARRHRRAVLYCAAPPGGRIAPDVQRPPLPRCGGSDGSLACLSQHCWCEPPHRSASPQYTHTLHARSGDDALLACCWHASQQAPASGFLLLEPHVTTPPSSSVPARALQTSGRLSLVG